MLYFINPGERRSTRRRTARDKKKAATRAIPRRVRKRLRREARQAGERRFGVNPVDNSVGRRHNTRRSSSHRSGASPIGARQNGGSSMARRRRRHRRVALASNPRRHRRRVHRRRRVALLANPRRRRPHRFSANPPRSVAANPRRRHHRRRFRRNPPIGSIINQLKLAAVDGASVFVGQVATRKLRGAVTGILPATTHAQVTSGVGYAALNLAAASGVAVLAHKFGGRYARLLAAGAFAEAISCAVAQTPVAPYLGAFPPRRVRMIQGSPGRRVSAGNLRAWPAAPALPAAAARSGMAAWPLPRVVGQ